jgi:hypothetical protein
MRWFLCIAIAFTAFSLPACTVQVEEKPAPIIKRDRDVDIKVDAPGVDVKVDK